MSNITPQSQRNRNTQGQGNEQERADMIRGQEPYDASLSVGSTINESLGMPALNSDLMSAEEAAIQVRDETPYADPIERIGQDEGLGDPNTQIAGEGFNSLTGDSNQRQVPMAMNGAENKADIKQALGQWRGRAEESLKSQPYGYVLGAVGLGFILGKILS